MGEYILEEKHHETGSFVLHRGRRSMDGVRVWLKLPSSDRPSAADIARLRYEFLLLNDLDTPRAVRPLGLEFQERGLALVLEDPGGEVLDRVLASRRLAVDEVLRVAIALAEALGEVHARGIIHRDIAPSNLLVDAALANVTLLSFGLATRLSQEVQRSAGLPSLEGALAYMAPEQTGRMNRVTDHRADLYAAGVTLYEMLTGALPFDTEDPVELVHCHIARPPVPPHERAGEVPRGLSLVVMKLLAKAAEERYQQAAGLKADLEACLAAWRSSRQIAPFALGRRDFRGKVDVQPKLYGRAAETAALVSMFERAGSGSAELVFISGGAGVGKSALVTEVYKSIAREGGYCVSGKFDVYGGGATPYAAIAGAIRELVRTILVEQPDVRARYRDEILRAVAPNGSVIVEIIPELAQLIGDQPPSPELGPAESQNRFNLVFQSFLRVFVRGEHPLVLFLDDMQWADPGSLKLLQTLLGEGGRLLVIGAYRDNEVGDDHPLTAAFAEQRRQSHHVTDLRVTELSAENVRELIADALGLAQAEVGALSALIFERTRGNAFFTKQLLLALEDERFLTFEPEAARFTWEIDRVRERLTTDDVVAFLIGRFRRFSPATQHALTLCACIGHSFDLKTLSVIHEKSPAASARDLVEAIREGLLLPMHAEYRLIDFGLDQDAELPFDAAEISYRFLHDRVQQAAYQLLPDSQREALHLRIGRLLRGPARGEVDARRDDLFDVVRHLNLGAALITDPEEHIDVARWNLAAGRRARAASAHETAAGYFAAGIARLPPGRLEGHDELVFGLQLSWAECAHLSGQHASADAMFEELVARARSLAERVAIWNLRVVLCFTSSRLAEAVRSSRHAFAEFGVSIPDTEEERAAMLAAEMEQIDVSLEGRSIEGLLDAPELTDPDQRVFLQLLNNVYVPMYTMLSPTAAAICTAKMVNISLRYGNSESSAFGYVTYGFTLQASAARYRESYQFCELGVRLNERFGNLDLACRLNVIYSLGLHFSRSRHVAHDHALRAHQAGLASGDFPFLSYSCDHIMFCRMCLGYELWATIAEADRFLLLMRRTKEKLSTMIITMLRQVARNITGQTRSPHSLDDATFDEAAFLRQQEEARFTPVTYLFYAYKTQVLWLHGDPAAALAASVEAATFAHSLVGQYPTTELAFFRCLAMSSVASTARGEERARHVEALARGRAELASWAEGCWENYGHKQLLISAEIARLEGREEATDLYERAIDAARTSRFASEECIALELAGRYHHSKGRGRLARVYLTEAYHGYHRWGAEVKTKQLAAAYADLLFAAGWPAQDGGAPSLRGGATVGASFRADELDWVAVTRAAQAIASETELDRVIERMMRILIENAGAQRGVLLLDDEEGLLAHAVVDVGSNDLAFGPSARSEAQVPRAVIEEVTRTGKPIVVRDALVDRRVAQDPQVVRRRPRSMLCVGMMYRGRRTGVVYLENSAVPDVFTPVRVEIAGLLASHAAIAVENALLAERLRASNASLEARIAVQTNELRIANERLKLELVERKRADEERLAELSTPIIPISERILVMPLIGTMDTVRADQVCETALRHASERMALAVILDVTGIRGGEADVAMMLMRTAAALQLLGVRGVVTGVRPAMARSLVELDVDLSALTICATLESGIAQVTSRRGGPGLR